MFLLSRFLLFLIQSAVSSYLFFNYHVLQVSAPKSLISIYCIFHSSYILKYVIISELDERMRDLKNELQSFEGEEYDESHKTKAIETLKRMESWNLFSDTHEVS